MKNKLYSVKGFQYERSEQPILDAKGEPTKVFRYFRKMTVIAKGLNFLSAKETRNKFSSLQASIFPDIKEEELKVIQLS